MSEILKPFIPTGTDEFRFINLPEEDNFYPQIMQLLHPNEHIIETRLVYNLNNHQTLMTNSADRSTLIFGLTGAITIDISPKDNDKKPKRLWLNQSRAVLITSSEKFIVGHPLSTSYFISTIQRSPSVESLEKDL